MLKQINDFDKAVSVLGGTTQAAQAIGRRAPQIAQWRSRFGAFPASLYFVVDYQLRQRGFWAGPGMFTFEWPRSRPKTAA
jgi:hypothetical protein